MHAYIANRYMGFARTLEQRAEPVANPMVHSCHGPMYTVAIIKSLTAVTDSIEHWVEKMLS